VNLDNCRKRMAATKRRGVLLQSGFSTIVGLSASGIFPDPHRVRRDAPQRPSSPRVLQSLRRNYIADA
jgi:hypothetical protein